MIDHIIYYFYDNNHKNMKNLVLFLSSFLLVSVAFGQAPCESAGFAPVEFISSGQTVEDVALFDVGIGYYLDAVDWQLDGTFIVDEDLLIANLEMAALGGAVIIVQPGKTLTVNSARFFRRPTATAMWEGIRLLPGATLIADDITICGANFGIDAQNTPLAASNFQVDGVYMSNDWFGNYVGLMVQPYPNAHPGSIQGIGMQGGALISGAPGGAAFSRSGVQIDRVGDVVAGVGITIGESAANQNVFAVMEFGIEARKSVCEVQHCRVINGNSLNGNGVGIFSSATINEPGILVARDNRITTRIGISTKSTQEVNINNNVLSTELFSPSDDMEVGILINQADALVTIEDNSISQFTEYGIYILDVRALDGIYEIINNGINSSYDDAPQYDLTAIHIDNSATFSPVTNPFVFDNTINNVQRGIYLMDQPSVVENNTINFQRPIGSTKPAAGIVNITGDASNILNNTINGNCSSCTDLNVRGIQNYDATHVFLIDNHITDCGFGVLLNENVWEGAPYCNELHNCFNGFGLDNLAGNPAAPTQLYGIGGVVGSDPNPTDNKWYPEATAIRTNTGPSTDGMLIDWFYRSSPAEFNMPAFLNDGIFEITSIASTMPGSTLCPPVSTENDSSLITAIENPEEAFGYFLRSMRSSVLLPKLDDEVEQSFSYVSMIEDYTTFGWIDSLEIMESSVLLQSRDEREVLALSKQIALKRQLELDSVYLHYAYHDQALDESHSIIPALTRKSDRMLCRFGLNYPIPRTTVEPDLSPKSGDTHNQDEPNLVASFVGEGIVFNSQEQIECILVYSIDGQIVASECVNCKAGTISISGISAGIYIVQFQTLEQFVSRKLVKTN